MVSPLLIALAIEGLAFLYQKGYKKHDLGCRCSTCMVINVTIPVTLGLTFKATAG